MDLAEVTHAAVDRFEREYRYAYGGQFRRAAISVAQNISEGAARQYRKEFVQFLYIARGSVAELHTLMRFARRVRLCPDRELDKLTDLIDHVGRMLSRMVKALGPKDPRASGRRS